MQPPAVKPGCSKPQSQLTSAGPRGRTLASDSALRSFRLQHAGRASPRRPEE